MDNHGITLSSKEIDSPPEEEEVEDDSEPSEAESNESDAESPLSIRRFFLPRAGVVILEESSDSDDEGRRFFFKSPSYRSSYWF